MKIYETETLSPIEQAANLVTNLQRLIDSCGDWYDGDIKFDFGTGTTTVRLKRQKKLKTLGSVDLQGQMHVIGHIPAILDNTREIVEGLLEQHREYHEALTRILKAYANGSSQELIDALADADFEIDHDGSLICGESREGQADG